MRNALKLLLACGVLASARPLVAEELPRIAVFVGANEGSSGDEPLRYADADARRMRDVLVELGGVRGYYALLVTSATRPAIERALNEARGRVAELAALGRAPLFVFYYSGHGDANALHTRGAAFPISELRAELEKIPAKLRVVVIDACRTGARMKGVHAGPSFALPTVEETHGTIELSASAAGEAAQESEELGGAIFTHYLASGLRGAADSDGDGRVTLLELYSYAYRRTLLRTSGSEVLQHPSWSINVEGAGELPISFPSRAALTLDLPPGNDQYLVFNERNSAPMGEVLGQGLHRIALPPGRYLVSRRAPGRHAIAIADGSWGGLVQLRSSDFRVVSEDQISLRGGHMDLQANRVDVRLGGEWLVGAADAGAARVTASVSRYRGHLVGTLELGYGAAYVSTPTLHGVDNSIGAALMLGGRRVRGRLTLTGQIGFEVRGFFESLQQRDASRVMAAGYPTHVDRASLGVGPRLDLSLGVALGHNLTGVVWLSDFLFLRGEQNVFGHDVTVLRAALGGGIGIGRAF